MSDKVVEYKGRVLPKGWPREVAKMVQEILEDYSNPDFTVALAMEIHDTMETDGYKEESITVTRSNRIK